MKVLPVYLLLLAASCCSADDDEVRIVPNQLQFFVYDSLVLDCVGSESSVRWTVKRRVGVVETDCRSKLDGPAGRCKIHQVYDFDSGEYWCDARGGGRSNAVYISVTNGDVILHSPVVPVTAGENVTLSCLTKTKGSDVSADFYRNGSRFQTGDQGIAVIHNVSAEDGGRYKCKVASLGESPESWLLVREQRRSERRPSPWRFTGVTGVVSILLVLAVAGVAYVSSKRRRLRWSAAETPTESGRSAVNLPECPVYTSFHRTRSERTNMAAGAPPSRDRLNTEADFGFYSLIREPVG